MIHYSYEEFLKDATNITRDIEKSCFEPDAIVAIARGGMTFGHFLSIGLDMRDLYSLNSIHYDGQNKLDTVKIFNVPDLSKKKKILLVDEIIDSGETLLEIKKTLSKKFPHLEIKVATLFYKSKALLAPEYSARHADDWINFFWDDISKDEVAR